MAPTLLPKISIGSSTFSRMPLSERRKYHKLGTLSCMSLIVNKMIGTGIFLTPAIIFQYCQGNVGLYLFLWLVGGIIIFSGLVIFLEFALNLPFTNGGEKNYLLRVFRKPKGLMGCIYSFQMVLLGFSSGNAFAFGKYVLFAVNGEEIKEEEWSVKMIGILCISICIFLHIKFPNQGTSLFNLLGVFKIFILVLIIAIGLLVSVDIIKLPTTVNNFSNLFESTTKKDNNYYSISVALLEIIYSFKGWENANYVLLEVSDPYHVLTIAAPSAVVITTILYFLVIISYLIVIPKQELLDSGVLVAGIFFNKVFGESITSRILPIIISSSNLGNVMVVSFAHAHVNQELARNNYLPFSKYFEDINNSLLLHWFITVIIMVAPPSSEIYEFVVNLYIYPGTWINLLITIGLIYLHLNSRGEKWGKHNTGNGLETNSANNSIYDDNDNLILQFNDDSYTEFDSLISVENDNDTSKFSAPIICIVIFLFSNIFLAVFPFFPPPSDSSSSQLIIPYWCFPVVGTSVLLLGVAWFYIRRWFHTWRYDKYKIGEPNVKYEDDYSTN